jgi:tripeptidyl-peptidase-1
VTTVYAAEKLMPGIAYHEYEMMEASGVRSVTHRTSAFSLPEHVQEHVDFVAPTTRFPLKKLGFKHGSREMRLGTNPDSLRSLYGLGDVEATGAPGNSQHVAGFIGNYFSPQDLQTFFSQYYQKGKGRTASIVGPNDASNPTAEGSLDVEYIMAIGANVPTTYWYTPGARPYDYGDNEPFVDWLIALNALSDDELPTVVSVSYADEEFVIDPDFADRIDVEFQKLSVRGVSLLFGSGDDGVTGDKGLCPDSRFVSWWPASSPFVTAVGATEEYNSGAGASFSGGGFSNRYGAPAFQQAHIDAYLREAEVPAQSWWNRTGAGFPDVAACGMGYWTVTGGLPDEVGGTSAATPTFAGIVSLLNDARMAAGMNPLGPLNQVLYKHPEVFVDITSGTNSGGGGCGVGGFSAAPGWDPVTGLGTPKYPDLLKLVMSLPSGKSVMV